MEDIMDPKIIYKISKYVDDTKIIGKVKTSEEIEKNH